LIPDCESYPVQPVAHGRCEESFRLISDETFDTGFVVVKYDSRLSQISFWKTISCRKYY